MLLLHDSSLLQSQPCSFTTQPCRPSLCAQHQASQWLLSCPSPTAAPTSPQQATSASTARGAPTPTLSTRHRCAHAQRRSFVVTHAACRHAAWQPWLSSCVSYPCPAHPSLVLCSPTQATSRRPCEPSARGTTRTCRRGPGWTSCASWGTRWTRWGPRCALPTYLVPFAADGAANAHLPTPSACSHHLTGGVHSHGRYLHVTAVRVP